MIYFFYILTIFSLSIFNVSSRRVLKINFFLTLLFFTLSMGYGTDWIYYKYKFDYATSLYELNAEVFYSLLIMLFKWLGLDYQWVHMATSAISISCLYLYSDKFKYRNIIFICAVSIFGTMLFLAQERQGAAVCLFLLSTVMRNKKRTYFVLFSAFLFHYSALFGLVYFYFRNRVEKCGLIRLFLEFNCLLLLFFCTVYFSLVVLSGVGVDLLVYEKLSNYFSWDSFSFDLNTSYILNLLILIYMIVYYIGDKSAVNRGAVLFSLIFIQFRISPMFLYRFNYYFLPFLFLAIDEYINKCISKRYRFNIYFLFLFFFCYSLRGFASLESREELMTIDFYLFQQVNYSELKYEACSINLKYSSSPRPTCI